MTRRLAPLLLLAVLAGCAAKVPWVNTALPAAQWDRDWSACKRAAEYQAGGGRDWDDMKPGDPFAAYDRQRASGQVRDQVNSCMIGKGYIPTERLQ